MGGLMHTLDPKYIGENSSGWEISGDIVEDGFVWVDYFYATHLIYGCIRGNFDDLVQADSK